MCKERFDGLFCDLPEGHGGAHRCTTASIVAAPTAPDDITEAELEAIKARCEAATPGPWDNAIEIVPEGYALRAQGDPGASLLSVDQDGMGIFDRKEDATFTAHARTDLPRLIAALRKRDAELKEANAGLMRGAHEAISLQDKTDAAKALLAKCVTLLGMITNDLGNRPADIAALLAEIEGADHGSR
jgi:hypothetical protein